MTAMKQTSLGLPPSTKRTRKQQFFAAMDEALHDLPVLLDLAGRSNWGDTLPRDSSILRCRRPLKHNNFAGLILGRVNAPLTGQELMLKAGTAVDATLIAAPNSTGNKDGTRDPEMHQSRKGKQKYSGRKAQIGVDADSGLVHTARDAAGNVSHMAEGNRLLHRQEALPGQVRPARS